MHWDKISDVLKDFYALKGLGNKFIKDEKYLSQAFWEIDSLWEVQYKKISTIKYIMLSEAPLWGKTKKYIYNPVINNSQFFYRSDLEYAINKRIRNKAAFIEFLNEIGFIVLDISPYALNSSDTIINYRELSINDYRKLIKNTMPFYFERKLESIVKKRNENVQVFYRYGRVRNAFNDLIGEMVVENGLALSIDKILEISQQGGGIDRNKLKKIIAGVKYPETC